MIKYVSLFALGAMNEVEALRKAIAEAEEKAAAEQALREKHEARVIEAEQELQESVKKCETLEHSLRKKRIRTRQGSSGRARCPGGNPRRPVGDPRGEDDHGG